MIVFSRTKNAKKLLAFFAVNDYGIFTDGLRLWRK